MPMNTIKPIATTDESQFPSNGASAHAVLSDSNDGSFCTAQVSTFVATRQAWHTGPSGLTALPPEAGVIDGTVVNIRGYVDDPVTTGAVNLFAGAYGGSLFSQPVVTPGGGGTSTITTYSSGSLGLWTTGAQVAAAGWVAGIEFGLHDGVQGFITDISFDVTWSASKSAFRSVMIAMGPLAGVLLSNMPALAAEVYRRTGTRILPEEYDAAWRALREDRQQRYFLPPPRLSWAV